MAALFSADPPLVWALLPGTGILIGLLAGFLGVGGRVMSVPILLDVFAMAIGDLSTPALALRSFPIKRAIGAGTLFNLVISRDARDVALFCVAALSLPALFVAPVTARWSARAPVSLLRRLFALCLAAIALRLLVRS